MQGLVSEQGADLASTLLRQLALYRGEMLRLLHTHGRDEGSPQQAEEDAAAAADGAGGQEGKCGPPAMGSGSGGSGSKGTTVSTSGGGSGSGKAAAAAAAKAEQAARNQKRFNAHME